MPDTAALIARYYDTFNGGDRAAFLALLSDDVVHDISQGAREIGKPAFARFLERMDRCYRERIVVEAICVDATGARASAEYIVHGTYLATDTGLPPARGQTYVLPGGAFFTVQGGRVARIANHYNLEEWLRQISKGS